MQQPVDLHTAGISAVRSRVVYDALTRISRDINKGTTVEQIIDCIRTDVKYVLDSIAIKFYIQDDVFEPTAFFVTINKKAEPYFHESLRAQQLPQEQQVAATQIVQHHQDAPAIRAIYGSMLGAEVYDLLESVWLFPFCVGTSRLVVTVFSGTSKRFRKTDIPSLKIMCETFLSRLVALQLYDEMVKNKHDLTQAYHDIAAKNARIEQLLHEQEATIRHRTRELSAKNHKLLEIVVLNAHKVREPLTRIMGLINIAGHMSADEVVRELLPLMSLSCDDLDKAIKVAVAYIEKE